MRWRSRMLSTIPYSTHIEVLSGGRWSLSCRTRSWTWAFSGLFAFFSTLLIWSYFPLKWAHDLLVHVLSLSARVPFTDAPSAIHLKIRPTDFFHGIHPGWLLAAPIAKKVFDKQLNLLLFVSDESFFESERISELLNSLQMLLLFPLERIKFSFYTLINRFKQRIIISSRSYFSRLFKLIKQTRIIISNRVYLAWY